MRGMCTLFFETLNGEQLQTRELLSGINVGMLVGETALALQCGHRKSDGIGYLFQILQWFRA